MTNERVKTLPATELDHFLSTEFTFNEQTLETRTRTKASNNFHLLTRIVQNEKKRRTVIERDDEDLHDFKFQTTSSLTVYMFE